MNLYCSHEFLEGWILTKWKKKREGGGTRCTEFVEESCPCFGGGKAVFCVTAWGGVSSFLKLSPLPGRGVFSASLHCTFQGTVNNHPPRKRTACLWVPVLWPHSTRSLGGLIWSLLECVLVEVVYSLCAEQGLWNISPCRILAGQIFSVSRPELYFINEIQGEKEVVNTAAHQISYRVFWKLWNTLGLCFVVVLPPAPFFVFQKWKLWYSFSYILDFFFTHLEY